MDKLIRIVRRIVISAGIGGLCLFVFTSMGQIMESFSDETGVWTILWMIGLIMALPFFLIVIVTALIRCILGWVSWLFELEFEQLGISKKRAAGINLLLGFDLF